MEETSRYFLWLEFFSILEAKRNVWKGQSSRDKSSVEQLPRRQRSWWHCIIHFLVRQSASDGQARNAAAPRWTPTTKSQEGRKWFLMWGSSRKKSAGTRGRFGPIVCKWRPVSGGRHLLVNTSRVNNIGPLGGGRKKMSTGRPLNILGVFSCSRFSAVSTCLSCASRWGSG